MIFMLFGSQERLLIGADCQFFSIFGGNCGVITAHWFERKLWKVIDFEQKSIKSQFGLAGASFLVRPCLACLLGKKWFEVEGL